MINIGVTKFAEFYTSLKLNSCYGTNPNPYNFTTFHARTHLQTQLNKAISIEEKDIKGDKNPKDFILFFSSDFDVLETIKDNTGEKKYIEGMVFIIYLLLILLIVILCELLLLLILLFVVVIIYYCC